MIIAGLLALNLMLPLDQEMPRVYATGRSIKDQGITLNSWGSGTCKETEETGLDGIASIRVTTQNYFQGGIINLSKPIDLAPLTKNPNALLRLSYQTPDLLSGWIPPLDSLYALAIQKTGGAAVPGTSGSNAAPKGKVNNGVHYRDFSPIDKIRLVFTTTDGKKSEIYLDTSEAFAVENDWRSAAFPISAVNGIEKTNMQLSSLSVSADKHTALYIGDLRFVNDPTPITARLDNELNINLSYGQGTEFRSQAYAGSTILKYTWDFDDSDGIQVDAEGAVVRRRFFRAGDFNVTCTVSDLYGMKTPVTLKLKVKVNP